MSGRGKAAGAALKIAAPEAAAAGAIAGKRKSGGPDRHKPRNLNGLSPEERDEELAARKADAKWAADERKAGRDPDRSTKADEDQADEDQADEDQADTGRRPSPTAPFAGMQGPATGGGFALGLIVWALVRAYIGNPGHPSGTAGVKALVNAKLFNKVTATTATK